MRPRKKRILKRHVRLPRKQRETTELPPGVGKNAWVREAFNRRQTIFYVIVMGTLLAALILQQLGRDTWGAGLLLIAGMLFVVRIILPIISHRSLYKCPKCGVELPSKWYNPTWEDWKRCPHCGIRLS